MKKVSLFFVIAMLSGFSVWSQSVVVAGWSFPGNSAVADTGVAMNLDREIGTMGGTSDISFKNGYTSKAAQVTGWNDGMDTKAWLIYISTEGYQNLTISSRQQSGGEEPGPNNYKIQYSKDAGANWINVDNGDILVENDWETSFVDKLLLPDDCNDRTALMIRWVMTSNEASGGAGTVLETGKSKIDEIYVRGDQLNGIGQNRIDPLVSFGPNPADDYINIYSKVEMVSICLYDITGKLIKELEMENLDQTIDISELKEGIYVMSVMGNEGLSICNERIIIQ